MTPQERINEIDKIILNLELSDQDFINAKYIRSLLEEKSKLLKQLNEQ